MTGSRPGVPAPHRQDLRDELARLRREAERRHTEMDLLVSALNEHIADLRMERDRLLADLDRTRADLERAREEASLLRTEWFLRGHKGVRGPGPADR